MSHFTVLVIGHEDLDKALYPYHELDLAEDELKADPRSKFNDCTQEVTDDWKTKKFLIGIQKHQKKSQNIIFIF
jgi:hypothetical protein